MRTQHECLSGAVWVWLPAQLDGSVGGTAYTHELLYEAKALARRFDVRLVAFTATTPTPDLLDMLHKWHVQTICVADTPATPHPICVRGESVLHLYCHTPFPRPTAVLFSADAYGLIAAPLLAAELELTYVPHVTSLTSTAAGKLLAARYTHGDLHQALVEVSKKQGMVVTLTPGAIGSVNVPAEWGTPPSAPQLWHKPGTPPGPAPPDSAVLTENQAQSASPISPPDLQRVSLSDAERIVAFGRGAFSKEATALVYELATLLNAVVGGTRPAADEGWLPFSKQIGLTGAVVKPMLYVAIGISGAPYHMVGIEAPQVLVAINQDPAAPIFDYAQFGIVGDLFAVLPPLITALQNRTLHNTTNDPDLLQTVQEATHRDQFRV